MRPGRIGAVNGLLEFKDWRSSVIQTEDVAERDALDNAGSGAERVPHG
jgi:hypothetical protein